jgi:uncharacterized membrane protein YgcG
MPGKKKKTSTEVWKLPAPSSFLECTGAMIPAVRGEELKKLTRFKKIAVSQMQLGEAYYIIYDVGVNVPWGHLGRPVEIAGKMIRVQFANCNLLTEAENDESDYFVDMELNCTDLAYIIPTEHIAPIAERLEAVNMDEEKITMLIMADKTIKRISDPERREARAAMLTRAVHKVLLVNPKELAQAVKSEKDMSTLMVVFVDEAINEILQACDANSAANEQSEEVEVIEFGNKSTNYNIAALIMMKILKPNAQQSQESQELATLTLEIRKEFKHLSKQVEMLAVVQPNPKPAMEAKAQEKVAGKISMDGSSGQCCYHAGAVAVEISKDPSVSLSKIFNMPSAPLVMEAKKHLVENFLTIHNKLENFADLVDGKHFASEQWKEALGMSPDAVLNEVKEGKEGGIVSLAMIAYHTHVEILVAHEESIIANGSDKQEVGVYAAMLETLPAGPVEKTKRMFVILRKKHFYFAFTEQGDNKRAIFDIGEEADEAQALFVALVKSEHKGPLADLSEADRKQAIAKALDPPKAVSWSEMHQKGGPAAGKHKTTQAAVPVGQKNVAPVVEPAEAKELCRNYERYQNCRYGATCKFEHDDSRKARGRRKRKRKQAEAAAIVKESRSRNRQPANGGGHERGKDESRSPSRSRSGSGSSSGSRSSGGRSSISRGRSRSRSSSRSRSPQPRKPQWTTVGGRKEVKLRVRCRKEVPPVVWRNSLRSINKDAHSLVTWAERDPADEEWLEVQCKAEEVGKLEKLLLQDFTVARQRRRPNKESAHRTHHCADFLNGDRRCQHSKPYCK